MLTDTQLTEIIIGAAYTVLNTLKPGLDEKLYERALVIELTNKDSAAIRRSNFLSITTTNSLAPSFPI